MKHGVDYALKTATIIAGENGRTLKLKDADEKLQFVSLLTNKDEVYLEFGSAAEKFSSACLKNGAQVFRMPTNIIKQLRNKYEKQGAEISPEIFRMPNDAEIILEAALQTPEVFYKISTKDTKVMELGRLLQKYYIVQKDIRKKAGQRLFMAEADALLAQGNPVAELEETLRKQISEHPMFAGALKEEKKIYKEIGLFVSELPIYQEIFKPIKGVGVIIAGSIICAIGDIRRFATPAHLKNYAGYGFHTDGSAQKRKRGQVASWNEKLKQAVYLFCDQVNRRKKTKWNDMLLARKDYERQKFPDATKGHIHAKAMRYVGQKFLEHIWRAWRQFEKSQTTVTCLPNKTGSSSDVAREA